MKCHYDEDGDLIMPHSCETCEFYFTCSRGGYDNWGCMKEDDGFDA